MEIHVTGDDDDDDDDGDDDDQFLSRQMGGESDGRDEDKMS